MNTMRSTQSIGELQEGYKHQTLNAEHLLEAGTGTYTPGLDSPHCTARPLFHNS